MQAVSAASFNSENYYGDHRIDWSNDVVDFYANGTKVCTQSYAHRGPVAILVRSFDLSLTITATQVAAATMGLQKPAKDPCTANVFGARRCRRNPSGAARWTCRSRSTPRRAMCRPRPR